MTVYSKKHDCDMISDCMLYGFDIVYILMSHPAWPRLKINSDVLYSIGMCISSVYTLNTQHIDLTCQSD